MEVSQVGKSQFEQKVNERVSEVVEHIVTEMGAEIHDDLMQKLLTFRLYLERIERSLSEPEEMANLLREMKGEFEHVNGSVRDLSKRLMPVFLESGELDNYINYLCQNMQRNTNAHIEFEVKGTVLKLDANAKLYLYRIVQELIHNALKHSFAWHIRVALTWLEKGLRIQVEDDGSALQKIDDFIENLKNKKNTLYIRTRALGASIQYEKGTKGLIATVDYTLPVEQS